MYFKDVKTCFMIYTTLYIVFRYLHQILPRLIYRNYVLAL